MGHSRIRRWVVPILVLPVTVMIVIPSCLLWLSRDCACAGSFAETGSPRFWFGVLAAIPGVIFCYWSGRMFFLHGEGTAAPWDPPQKLVIRGPYRHVRNPMITGVIFILIAETILFRSPAIGIWSAIFALGNAIYFPLVEEPGLAARFGEDYDVYRKHVRRWVPRLKGWDGMTEDQGVRQGR